MDSQLLLASYPEPFAVDRTVVADELAASGSILIVLDDDPTGTQSVADVPVLTAWEEADVEWAFDQGRSACYVLTNSRSLAPEEAARITHDVVATVSRVADRRGLGVTFVSRSDSTLRGHFPLETDTIISTLDEAGEPGPDIVLLVPAFPDAGRITVGGVHYFRQGNEATPVGETEFARDATFGYRSSDLREWVEEKTRGRVLASQVVSLDLALVRQGPDAVVAALSGLTGGRVVVADAADESDLLVVALAVGRAEKAGKRFVHRVGPAFVRARLGQHAPDPLTPGDLRIGLAGQAPGLIVAGSHVGLTTRQLAVLRERRPDLVVVEVEVDEVLDAQRRDAYVAELTNRVVEALGSGDVLLQTSRRLVTGGDGDASLAIARAVSQALVDVVHTVVARRTPGWVVAKGGITSSDVASRGLEIRRAMVAGPMLPGLVSMWLAADGPAAGLPYVVFPGNVGGDDALAQVVATLTALRG
ncbi:MAG: hypothetical protein LBM23_05875 [Propionibacteriaceae bacterium]|jgi:uncharacterized protein YgbK (DUF1537 family)|nr:hypothetical protein [Propionibacteriaceae bacterium]